MHVVVRFCFVLMRHRVNHLHKLSRASGCIAFSSDLIYCGRFAIPAEALGAQRLRGEIGAEVARIGSLELEVRWENKLQNKKVIGNDFLGVGVHILNQTNTI